MLDGWIKLHRCIYDHWIWKEPVKLKWWLDLILMANHKEKKILINDELIVIERGSYHTSELKLAERWSIDRKTVRKFLDLLEKDEMIRVEKSRKLGTTIKICNYESYQKSNEGCSLDNTKDKGKDKKKDNAMDNMSNNTMDINKNDNNENKENKKCSHSSVYEAFEGNGFGLLSPVMVDIINDLVETYGEQWAKDAVFVAVASGRRNIKYVQGILKNWSCNGRDNNGGEVKNGIIKQDINGVKGNRERDSFKQKWECGNGEWSDFKPAEPKLKGDFCCEGLI